MAASQSATGNCSPASSPVLVTSLLTVMSMLQWADTCVQSSTASLGRCIGSCSVMPASMAHRSRWLASAASVQDSRGSFEVKTYSVPRTWEI